MGRNWINDIKRIILCFCLGFVSVVVPSYIVDNPDYPIGYQIAFTIISIFWGIAAIFCILGGDDTLPGR